jgi:hypothetical protein
VTEQRGLVLDASVCINLLGSGAMAEILTALARPVTVVAPAAREVLSDPFRNGSPGAPLAGCVEHQLLTVTDLDGSALETFVGLTAAVPPDDLDDGEAATIAFAEHRELVAVVDEKKGLRVATTRFPHLELLTSVDLLRVPAVLTALGRERLADAVFSACVTSRMRVPREHSEWVRELIGPERAEKCRTLNGSRRPARNEEPIRQST